MKVKDISKASAVVLEGQRQREIKVQSWFPITSPYYERQAKRIARIDRQIAATAERHIAHLREQMQKHTALGNAPAASDYATRIAEVEAMAIETAFEHNEAEQMAEPMLRLAKTEDPAITRARQMVADRLASKQMQADLATLDRHERIIEQANTEGRTVGRTIHYYRDGALANLRRATQNDAAAVRWSNRDFANVSKTAGGVLEAQFCKNKECQAELAGPDEGAFAEVGRYGGYCADCYEDVRSGDLEDQLERMLRDA